MTVENVTTSTTATSAVGSKAAGDTITAAQFQTMLDIVDNLASHGHTFTDDYSTNCECQCQRGSL
jgi:hypothetical protein